MTNTLAEQDTEQPVKADLEPASAAPDTEKPAGSATAKPVVLAIDVGGSHVKVLSSAGGAKRAFDSGKTLTARDMIEGVKEITKDMTFDAISIGFPGPIVDNRPAAEPFNLGKGWLNFDFSDVWGVPVKLVNDALMQAIGSYEGRRMLFLGLGTGLGSAMVIEHVAQPMELAHLPYKKDQTFEDYLGERGLERRGRHKWEKSVHDVVAKLKTALQPDYIVIGGGNVDDLKELPENCRRGDNKLAFEGGFRLWHDGRLVLPTTVKA